MLLNNVTVFKNKKLSDLFLLIYTNHHEKNEQINSTVQVLQSMVKTVDLALMIVPTIAQCLSVGMKNDEMLVKLTTVISKILETSIKLKFLTQGNSGGSTIITLAEFELIINNAGKQALKLINESTDISKFNLPNINEILT